MVRSLQRKQREVTPVIVTPLTPVLRGLRQEGGKFKASLDVTGRTYLTKPRSLVKCLPSMSKVLGSRYWNQKSKNRRETETQRETGKDRENGR